MLSKIVLLGQIHKKQNMVKRYLLKNHILEKKKQNCKEWTNVFPVMYVLINSTQMNK